jgi:hypothetical protein
MRIQDRWYNRIPRDSKQSDIKAHRPFDPAKFITTSQLKALQIKQENICFHCEGFMDWIERRGTKNGLTVERLDNRYPHHVDNVVLCCKSCNSQKLNEKKHLLKKYFRRWYHKVFTVRPNLQSQRRCSFIT